jgi:hypothetical protein
MRNIIPPERSNPSLHQECPHCHHTLSLREAIAALRGTCDYPKMAMIKRPDGSLDLVEAGQVFPCAGEVLDDDYHEISAPQITLKE